MAAEFYLARRYLLNHRPGAWGWMIGWMATGSVALGVAALIITLAVMSGFRDDIRQKILGVQPHVLINSFDNRLRLTPALKSGLDSSGDVQSWAPYVTGQVLMGRGQQSSGALIKGIDPSREMSVSDIKSKLLRGDWKDLTAATPGSKPRIFLGQELARNVGARLGDTVWIITPGALGMPGLSLPKANLFIVGGFVQTGLYDYDSSLAYVALPAAQQIFGIGEDVTGVGIRIRDPDNAEKVARGLQLKFQGDYWIHSWLSLNHNLFSALKLEKTVMFIILILITIVASIMIVSNLLLSIAQKVKEIGILRAMGATGRTIRLVFLIEGALMGCAGTLIGVLLGTAISVVLARTNFIHLPADVYYIDRLPVRLDPLDIFTVIVAACGIVLVATLYPAHRATKLDPLDAIRYG